MEWTCVWYILRLGVSSLQFPIFHVQSKQAALSPLTQKRDETKRALWFYKIVSWYIPQNLCCELALLCATVSVQCSFPGKRCCNRSPFLVMKMENWCHVTFIWCAKANMKKPFISLSAMSYQVSGDWLSSELQAQPDSTAEEEKCRNLQKGGAAF